MKRVLEWFFSVALAGVFLYAGLIKFLDPSTFLVDIESYRILPYRLAYFAALFLPSFEILMGVSLLVPRFRFAGSLLLAFLMALFTVALASVWVRGLDISCGCFGKSESAANYPLLLLRDVVLIALLAVVCFLTKRHARTGGSS